MTKDAALKPTPPTPNWRRFGESVPGYEVPVLNERAVRAAAGLLFVPALISFMNAWLLGNFQPTRLFVVAFLIDFALRLFVSPRWAPSLVLGQWLVRRQQPEWVGAPQKRFAWAIGFVLALTMFVLVVVQQVIGPLNILVCATCLTLMFFESALGICIGCKLYNLIRPEAAQHCPGGSCALPPDPAVQVDRRQAAAAAAYAVVLGVAASLLAPAPTPTAAAMKAPATETTAAVAPQASAPANAPGSAASAATAAAAAEAERCKVPDFAKAIGHEEMWKRHNHC
ncbi:uncharacterized protein DUF4395 [Tibeticola sediminis]|uniref:Uncharacterized protein DUF4395 n=1 Tax=Tibeticola sediminis TaxID=1917811 RepID=A0A3N4U7F9_9BURK|nr:DUF4395 domain-containing protein [Tibeticola sediminis]RPE66673.1 uncharacterized protein DUF4395 [Tibeticola sediminis]